MIAVTDNEICGGCGAYFDEEEHAPDCPNKLSKWWQSDSCAQAYERANQKKHERLAAMKTAHDQKQEELKRDVELWEAEQTPFNLAGESQSNELTSEGTTRAREEARINNNKQQGELL
jgi:hypothetical protein